MRGGRTAAFVLTLSALVPPAAAAQPDRTSLLAAWENQLRADPQTLVFEKIDDDRYHFSTERFPFDGTIRVLNLVVDDRTLDYAEGGTMGVVEVDLENLNDEFRRQHAYSIGLWQASNTLYYDADSESWVSAAQWQSSMMDRYAGGGWWGWISSASWFVFLLLLLVVLFFAVRRANKQIKTTMAAQDKALAEQERAIRLTEEAVELSRDSNRVLKEIRDLLRDRRE